MKNIVKLFPFLALSLLVSCTGGTALTQAERSRQQAADYAVASILFENDLGGHASWNVHRDGSVVILFDESVSFADYTRVVGQMRSEPEIGAVRAEQSGREVCPLRQPGNNRGTQE
jgi:hypothetical protein